MKIVKVEPIDGFHDYRAFIRENPHIEVVNVLEINGQRCVTYREEESIEKNSAEEDYKYIEDHLKERMIHRIELDDEEEFQDWLRRNSDRYARWQHIYRENDKIVVLYV